MSDPVTVTADEFGILRLYALDVAPEHAQFLREPGAAEQMLGVEDLDDTQIDVFPVWDLEGFGLYGYLGEGCGISEDQLDRARLEQVMGWVMLVRSDAFRGRAMDLTLDNRMEPIGCYRDNRTDWSARPLIAASAEPYTAPPLPPRAARAQAQRRGFALFATTMTLIVAAVVWLIL